MVLRSYQQQALGKSLERFKAGVSRQLIAHATGLGKGVLISNLAKHHAIDRRVLVVIHREELIRDTAERLRQWNPGASVGVEMASERSSPSDQYVVSSVQSIGKEGSPRLLQFNPADFGAVVVDEAHRILAPSYRTVLTHFGLDGGDIDKHRLLMGFTATPSRGDGVGLAAVIDEIVHSYGLKDAIRDGWLCDLLGEQIRTGTNLDSVRTQNGDLHPTDLANAVNNKARNQAIARYWIDKASTRPTIGFGVDIEHCKSLAEVFRGEGVKAEAVWGTDKERTEKIERFKAGDIQALFNVALLVEGWDWWKVAAVILARPTKSPVVLPQQIGRGTRIQKGIDNQKAALARGEKLEKQNCLVADICDVSSKHSLLGINSLFGLPPKMALKGKSVLAAVDEVEKVALTKPLADLKDAEDLDTLQAYAEKVDLLSVKYNDEVLQHSEFQWHLRRDGVYIITLPDKGWVTISPNALGWTVQGVVEGTTFGPSNYTELGDAFHFADAMLRQYGKRLLNLIRRSPTAKWCKDPISENQIKALKLRLNQLKMPEPTWGSMTKSDGVALHRKLYANITRKIA